MEFCAVVDESAAIVNLYQHQEVIAQVPCRLQSDTWRRVLLGQEYVAFSLWKTNGAWKMSLYKTDDEGFVRINESIPVKVQALIAKKGKPIL